MIKYRSDRDREMAIHYARRFGDGNLVRLLEEGVSTSEEATSMAAFFWRMVDQAGTDGKNGKPFSDHDRVLLERLMNSISNHLDDQGFEAEWDAEEDKA